MPVDRLLPTEEAADLLAVIGDFARSELANRVAEDEAAERFPRDVFARLGSLGVFGLPYPAEYGGSAQPYEVYLQVLEELAATWMSVAVGVSVTVMAAYPVLAFGTEEQREHLLPRLVRGRALGAYALSEPQAGSDISAMTTRARNNDEGYWLSGTKAWITHGSQADFYTTFARTGEEDRTGTTCFLVSARAPGLGFGLPERKMGLTASTTTAVYFDDVPVRRNRRVGAEGEGARIALSALDSGRLGIAACATGLAQAALDLAAAYAKERRQFGRAVAEFQGLQFLLADMAAAVDGARAAYLMAARKRDAGRPFTRDAAVAKLLATDAAMRVTTDAVQVLGGYGYTKDFPAERYLREAKVTQIFEGTNQIQRLVIARQLLK